MESLLAGIEATTVAQWARASRWGYAGLNAAHILGLALLVGAMVPLNLVRLGWRRVPAQSAARLLVPTAGAGLALAIVTGAIMFASRATEYAAMTVFQAKMALVAFGLASALLLHARYGLTMGLASPRRTAVHAALSLATWLAVLVLGRLIAFVGP